MNQNIVPGFRDSNREYMLKNVKTVVTNKGHQIKHGMFSLNAEKVEKITKLIFLTRKNLKI